MHNLEDNLKNTKDIYISFPEKEENECKRFWIDFPNIFLPSLVIISTVYYFIFKIKSILLL